MKKNQNYLQNKINNEDFQINQKTKKNSSMRHSLNSIGSNNSSNISSKFFSKKNSSIIKNLTNLSRAKIKSSKINKKEICPKVPLYPDPILNLNYIIGYTSKNCPNLVYNSFGDYEKTSDIDKESKINKSKKYFYFCSGSNIIKYDPNTKSQKIFSGHSKSITKFILACKGELIFSAEEGPNSIIKIWSVENNSCIKMFTTPLDKLKSLSESVRSKFLCVQGKEQNKELIIIFQIENLNNIITYSTKKVNYGINCIKYVPYSDDIIISCGYENIKFYRMKNSTLFEKTIVLEKFAKNNNFLCIDFNKSIFGDNYNDKGLAFIGSNLGQVIQISCQSQELEYIYLVDNAPILSICANEAFVVTGAENGNCRVWQTDFKQFIMEAKHDGGICAVDISYDSVEVLIGALNGSIGTLNVKNKNYSTLIRSPNGDVKILVVHPNNNFVFTVENWGSYDVLKIWDILNKDEIYEMNCNGDLISCVGAYIEKHFVTGFNSGIINIFDFEKNKLIYQCKPFKSSVENITFIQNYKIFISMSNLGNLSIHDCTNNFIQIKIINIENSCIYPDLSLSPDQNYFAINGSESKYIPIRNSETFDLKNTVNLLKNKFDKTLAKKLCLINKNLLGVGMNDCSITFYSLGKYEGIFIKEIKDVHIKEIKKFICSKNFNYFITCGEEGIIKVWDLKIFYNNYKSYQQYIGHSNAINGLVLIDSKGMLLSSSKNNGVYFWSFLGNITNYDDELIKVLERLDDPVYVNNLKNNLLKNNSRKIQEEKKDEILTDELCGVHMQKQYVAENHEDKNIYNVALNSKENNSDNTNNYDMEQEFKILPKYPVQDEEEKVVINNLENQEDLYKGKNSDINIKDKLLFSAKYIPNNYKINLDKDFKEEESNENKHKLKLEFCIGLSLNSMNNLLFNKEQNWFAFTVNNKIIIEYLIGERRQKILNISKDEISCILLSDDSKYLIAGIGKKNREQFASIFIYETNNFSLIKKLNIHPKGVQYICLSEDNKYLISLGTKEENSLCIWDFETFNIIDMKTLKQNYFSIVIENNEINNTNNKLKFITCSFKVISFWELNEENKLENIDVTLGEILINEEYNSDEIITGINLDNNLILLSTNKGSLLILDNIQKILLKKFIICDYPITKILFSESYFIFGGESPILYIWKYEDKNILNTLEQKQPEILTFDSSICSINTSQFNDECLLNTENCNNYYVNFNENKKMKISSSHNNTDINGIYLDKNESNIYTLGKEECIRCWTNDSFDQQYMIIKKNQKPDKFIYNQKNNILITQYENSYLTAFNLNELKSLGKIYIPDEDILEFNFIFDNNNILLITFQSNIYIISIKSYKPLSMIYCLLDIPNNTKTFPSKQKCSNISCLNIDADETYSAFTFSDGTVCVYHIEKYKGRIFYKLVDNFNTILLHSEKYNDEMSQELYYNLTSFRSEYKSESIFYEKFDNVIICYHESLKAVIIRNFISKSNINIINLNYFPYCMSINDNGQFMAVGTKEGIVLLLEMEEKQYFNNDKYKFEEYYMHYDKVLCLRFSRDSKKLISSSKNEILILNIEI